MSSCYVPCLPNQDHSFLKHIMSGCYLSCMPYPDLLSFLNLFVVIVAFLCAVCLLCCLALSCLFQITNEDPTRFFCLPSSILSICHQPNIITWLPSWFPLSCWDFCLLPCLLQNLDSHQSPSSLSSAVACLNLFQSSPNLHCILECPSHTLDDTLLVYDLGATSGLAWFKSDFFEYVKCSIPVCDISK